MKSAYLFIIIFCLYSCTGKEKIINHDDITIVDDIAYFKYDMSLVTGMVKKMDNNYVKYEGTFDNGKKVGAHKTWFAKEDRIQFINYWKNGIKDSIDRQYYLNGQLWFEGIYYNGKENGAFRTWYINGKPKSVEYYLEGKPDGVWKNWDENGELNSEIKYKDGELISQNYFDE